MAGERARPLLSPLWSARLRSLLLGAAGCFSFFAFASYHPDDLAVLSSTPNVPLRNIGGVVGAWLALAGRGGFGWAAFAVPAVCVLWAMWYWRGRTPLVRWLPRTVSGLCFLTALAALAALTSADAIVQTEAGGVIGYALTRTGRYYLGSLGTALLAGCVLLLSWVLVSDEPGLPRRWFSTVKAWLWSRVPEAASAAKRVRSAAAPGKAAEALREASASASALVRAAVSALPAANGREGASEESAGPRAKVSAVATKPKILTASLRSRQAAGGFQLPPMDLLTTPPPVSERQIGEDLQVNARILEETLREFGVEASCVNIDRGPAVTRYELAPAPGVKLTRIVSLSDDLALVLKAVSCHIVAPIPGKGRVGIDVPNSVSTIVYLKEIIASRVFTQLNSPLALGVGKDVSGQSIVADLRECPHLLVAGATGSGKTVCLNSFLTGIMCHATPDEVKFLMIDPKMVELVLFNDIPHLVAPVVTDAKRAGAALSWAVQEMERRYQVLAKVGVRNIDGYNEKVLRSKNGSAPAAEGEAPLERMPYIVIVIDELADLMMVSSQHVEESITRLAQLSRAVGLHIILATQRPSVDVITGVIKANFPARIAFQVASKVDSRTILDMNGADKLLGRGDLLFLKPGAAKPVRVQGCYVTDEEIERVVAHLKAQRAPVYDEGFLTQQDKAVETPLGEKDELYDMAKKLVLDSGQASTSLLQRRLRLGYGRAARMLDLMEQEGIVGPPQGSRPREVLAGEARSHQAASD
ncbi:MAG: DNA translocase FtsK [Candidatus Omnitrophica bacterium]|nr:DNA translocase FtsK [Candidatus Omnitrophota bacterium]